jgi:hypothetical protein
MKEKFNFRNPHYCSIRNTMTCITQFRSIGNKAPPTIRSYNRPAEPTLIALLLNRLQFINSWNINDIQKKYLLTVLNHTFYKHGTGNKKRGC